MRKIICYRRGCNNLAEYEIPGTPVLHLCMGCVKKLYPTAVVYKMEPRRPEFGPDEFKFEEGTYVEVHEKPGTV